MPHDIVEKYNEYLSESASALDIPTSLYKKAVQSYEAVGKYLNEAVYIGAQNGVSIYPQGSFALGTVTRPLKATKENEYDIDLACEISIPKEQTTPWYVKNSIGDQLKKSELYNKLLDEEKKRCWTIEYAEDDKIGFHLDILPCVPEDPKEIERIQTRTDYPELVYSSIAVTNKDGNSYEWSKSNPRGYTDWFKKVNEPLLSILAANKKLQLFESHKDIFASVEDVPDQLVKTPLQQAIQIMKRHRDIKFSGLSSEQFKPISIIITTLAALLYNDEDNVYLALSNIVKGLSGFSPLLEFETPKNKSRIIQRYHDDGKWDIGNPVNMGENFADRWHENNGARAKAFFEWTEWLTTDLIDNYDLHNILRNIDKPNIQSQKRKTHIELKGDLKAWGYDFINDRRSTKTH
jgi:cyclic GMP-AMP synthase DncV-like protein